MAMDTVEAYSTLASDVEPTKANEKATPVTEGSATILFPSANDVFYNPVQQFNRDLSVLGIRAWSKQYISARRVKLSQQNQRRNKRIKRSRAETEQVQVNPGPNDELEKVEYSQQAEQPLPEVSFNVLEALSATGLRAIRYAKEIPNLSQVIANDLSAEAVKQIELNSKHNGTTDKVLPHQGDARVVMYTTKKRFNVIDLDPYGSAAPFLDGAVQAVEDGGLLLVTCTDLAVLAGDSHPEKCFSQYGGTTIKQSDFCHEQALRMVLHTIGVSAARYGRHITPLLSLSIDFYVRLFVRVDTSPAQVKKLMSNTMLTYQCSGCKSHVNQPLGTLKDGPRPDLIKFSNAALNTGKECEICGFHMHIGGPMFAGPIHDHDFIDEILSMATEAENSSDNVFGTIPRIRGMLTLAKEELPLVPHHWSVAKLTRTLHCQNPPQEKILSALLNAGYEVSGSHTGPRCIKTAAPAQFMWDVMRAWIKLTPIREESIKPGTAGSKILERREPKQEVDFTHNPKAKGAEREKGLVRYQVNPTENWGPKAMAKGTTSDTTRRPKQNGHVKRKAEQIVDAAE